MTKQTNRPAHEVFVVEEGEGGFWTKIGAASPNKDGKGFSITLTALPINGRLSLREPPPTKNAEAGEREVRR